MQAFARRSAQDSGIAPSSRVPLSRRFTYRYVLAIAVFAAIAIASKVVVDSSSENLAQLSRQTSEAAQQSSRLIRITDLANRVAFQSNISDPQQLESLASELKQQSLTLQQVQEGLVNGDASLNLPKTTLPPELNALYNDPEKLRETIKQISSAGSLIADLKDSSGNNEATRKAELTLISDNETAALTGLDKALSFYTDQTAREVKYQESNSQLILGMSLLAALCVWFFLFRPMARSIHLETSQLEEAERMHRENNERQTFRNELSQALEVADTEGEVLATVGRAFLTVLPANPVELFLSDESQSHLRRAQVSPEQGAAGCPVDSQRGCAAIRRGQTVVYESSRMLNVCPKLPEHDPGVCSAVCVPVMFMGQALGVLHTVGPDGLPPTHTEIERLSVLASETGNRLGIMRNAQVTELQASTDGLTGLLNRRSLENAAHGLLLNHQPFTVAMADLDHFKSLNDKHGHEAGDKALRLFSSVLRTSLRPEDVCARYGGEEFVVLLPNTNIKEARAALVRLQDSLRIAITEAGTPAFTASWGLTTQAVGSTFEEIVAVADTLLYGAKRGGRDCIMIDREQAELAGMDPDAAQDATSEQPTAGPPARPAVPRRDIPGAVPKRVRPGS